MIIFINEGVVQCIRSGCSFVKTLEKLETFLVLAECCSFVETAKRLYCTQPTISNHIHQLEEQFECKLFYRTGKSVQLTKQGEIFLKYAKQITELVESASHHLKQSLEEELLSLHASSYIAGSFFPGILKKYKSKYPKQPLEIHTYEDDELKSSLQEGKTRLAFMPIYPEDESIRSHFVSSVLFEDEFPLIVPVDHPLTLRKEIHSRDLQNETLLLPESRYLQDYIISQFKQHGIQARFEPLNGFETMKQAVRSKRGIAFMPYSAVAGEIARGEVTYKLVSSFRIKRKNGFVVRKNVHLTEAEQKFFRIVQKYFCG